MPTLEVMDIYKKYGKKQVLSGACFCAKQGECVAIVGANGCGKSTLLGIIAGNNSANSGSIKYNDQELHRNRKLISQSIGYVPQENPLFNKLTVYDNLKFWYSDSNRSLKEDMVNGVPAQFGLNEYKNYTVDKLSGGMKKRLSIACSLVKNPPILVLDEPGASLDIVCKEDIKNYLKFYLQNGGTVVITSHEEAELELCDRMYLLQNGKLTELADKPTGNALMERMRKINA